MTQFIIECALGYARFFAYFITKSDFLFEIELFVIVRNNHIGLFRDFFFVVVKIIVNFTPQRYKIISVYLLNNIEINP